VISMDVKTIIKRYLPLTEATYYIMLSLVEPLHGYGIMQHAEVISEGKIKLGPGTLYGALSKLEKEGLTRMTLAEDRKKCYELTDIGKMVLSQEIKRLGVLFKNGLQILEHLEVN
jgi:DNA-binding PadR family transcriptional regulator